jgi:cobalt/nickel transport protein
MRYRLVNWLILLAVIVLAVAPLVFVESDSEFTGADGVAIEQIEADDPGVQPWFTPLFEPGLETASMLFALQAAIGAGVLGYVFGVFRTRRRLTATPAPTGAPAATSGPTTVAEPAE